MGKLPAEGQNPNHTGTTGPAVNQFHHGFALTTSKSSPTCRSVLNYVQTLGWQDIFCGEIPKGRDIQGAPHGGASWKLVIGERRNPVWRWDSEEEFHDEEEAEEEDNQYCQRPQDDPRPEETQKEEEAYSGAIKILG